MAELRRCLEESAAVSFVGILGDKYGFRPFPAAIDKHNFALLRGQLCGRKQNTDIRGHSHYRLSNIHCQHAQVHRTNHANPLARVRYMGAKQSSIGVVCCHGCWLPQASTLGRTKEPRLLIC